jgi:hypothetical protein
MHLAGYAAYARLLMRREIIPNPTSWWLWALGSLVAVFAYAGVTHDIAKLALEVACSGASIIIAVAATLQARFSKPDLADGLIAIMDVSVVIVWILSRNAKLTYVWLLFDVLLTFIPILRSTYQTPADERQAPWLIWTAAYLMLFVVCLVRWEGLEAALLPAVYSICHLAVGVMASARRRQSHQQV